MELPECPECSNRGGCQCFSCVFCSAPLPKLAAGMWVEVKIHLRCSDCDRTNIFLPIGVRVLQYYPCGHPGCRSLHANPACNEHLREMPTKVKQAMWKLPRGWKRHQHVREFFSGVETKPPRRRFVV